MKLTVIKSVIERYIRLNDSILGNCVSDSSFRTARLNPENPRTGAKKEIGKFFNRSFVFIMFS